MKKQTHIEADWDFWDRWYDANCTTRHKLISELIKSTNLDKHTITATVLNSYLEDLAGVVKGTTEADCHLSERRYWE